MSRAAQIEWWAQQAEAMRRAVASGSEARRRLGADGLIDEPRTGRAPAAQEILQGRTIAGGIDEERRRGLPFLSGGGGSAPAGAGPKSAPDSPVEGGPSGGATGGALGRARKLAAGYQPAVVKVVSYARGAARATATGQYVQREEVALETHDARLLADREAVAEEIKAWSAHFSKRAESQDVATIRLRLDGVRDTIEGRQVYEKAIAAGFDGHRHAWRLDARRAGELEARVVVAMAGAQKERFRIRQDRIGPEGERLSRRLDARSEEAVKTRIEAAMSHSAHVISIVPLASSHGRDGVIHQLTRLGQEGAAVDNRGRPISEASEIRAAAREWGPSLRSQSSRDTMHLIISAKAGTDVAALTNAARAFLHGRFGEHKFIFGVHTDKEADGHIHAHAIVTVRNEAGQKIHPSRATFRDWREAFAQHAQAQGLKIVATSARERASSQSYGPKDKAIVAAAERPRPGREARDRAYAADPANQRLIANARQRIRTARSNPIRLPASEQARGVVSESVSAWSAVVRENPENVAAKEMLERLTMAQTIGAILHAIENRVQNLSKEDAMAVTSERMAKDLRLMNEAVARTTDLLEGATKEQFREMSARYLETLANRIDLQRAQEGGVETLFRAEVEKIVGANADRLIARAEAIGSQEQREAASAQRLADRAIEAERRKEIGGALDPESQREIVAERAVVASSQQSAAREAREAAAAVEAAKLLADHPARPLPQTLAETDALAKLRAEQGKVLQEIEGEREEAKSIKSERMK
ncbi:relaxase/mobilization nuclease domain-containing protein (plasmid) [Bradyrhizobium sp. CCGUVB1N3]|uniref:relaxase/mobilization nuclease domain-containing protein n=1 Tax=Bradyrhizobium sp. CCGUVB1N3 TaxID=2949629 RepID=UPI0020B2911B|nr:relaxase/mobilization nuclease domain-containing protein [Bradyrhizobium sp. CCGUVB1N3]MCP3477923.1 relaxase/mobilization nuclease domain-containing protein [Bradyrhizobium sp. CCGUVB1N3]